MEFLLLFKEPLQILVAECLFFSSHFSTRMLPIILYSKTGT